MEHILVAIVGSVCGLAFQSYIIQKYNSSVSISIRRLLILEFIFWLSIAIVVALYTVFVGFNLMSLFERLSQAIVFSITFGILAVSLANSGSNSLLTIIAVKILDAKVK